jgi:hypothetical protein
MAAFTTMAIVGAAVVGAAATVHSVKQQKKAARKQVAGINQQERDAKEAAREQAGLDAARDDTGADIKLGRGDATVTPASGAAGEGGATSRPGAVGARVGGLGYTGNGVGGTMRRGKRPSESVGL